MSAMLRSQKLINMALEEAESLTDFEELFEQYRTLMARGYKPASPESLAETHEYHRMLRAEIST